jgi:hypothetical protein
MTKVLSYPLIDQSKQLPLTPRITPRMRSPRQMRDAQQLEIDAVFGSPTPVRLTDKFPSISQEKK